MRVITTSKNSKSKNVEHECHVFGRRIVGGWQETGAANQGEFLEVYRWRSAKPRPESINVRFCACSYLFVYVRKRTREPKREG